MFVLVVQSLLHATRRGEHNIGWMEAGERQQGCMHIGIKVEIVLVFLIVLIGRAVAARGLGGYGAAFV